MAVKFNLPQLNKQQQQMLAAGVIGLAAFGYIYFTYFWGPVSKRIHETQEKIEQVEGDITRAQAQAARLPRVEKELEALTQQAADAEKRLPKIKDVPEIIDMVSRLAKASHVNLSNFSPGNSSVTQYFTEIPYTLAVSGSYHDIGRFFASIALEERIFNVRDVTYSQSGAAVGKSQLTVQFVLVSYQYKG